MTQRCRQLLWLLGGCAVLLLTGCRVQEQHQQADVGRLDRYADFKSAHIPARDVWVWLPEGYDRQTAYAVLYMHDGQMLFDERCSWNGQSWNVDHVADSMQRIGSCRPFLVVGVDNHPTDRLTEYMPEKAVDRVPVGNPLRGRIARERFIADDYLRFLVEELKPFIDQHYATLPDAANTVVMGSSMGGLISLYALCEYPEIFGAAGCLSTHTPVAIDDIPNEAPVWSQAFREYLTAHLPTDGVHRVYMDYGDQTLDAAYAPYQQQVDSLFAAQGWDGEHFVSRFFAGDAHDERSWQSRLHIPLAWLLNQ